MSPRTMQKTVLLGWLLAIFAVAGGGCGGTGEDPAAEVASEQSSACGAGRKNFGADFCVRTLGGGMGWGRSITATNWVCVTREKSRSLCRTYRSQTGNRVRCYWGGSRFHSGHCP